MVMDRWTATARGWMKPRGRTYDDRAAQDVDAVASFSTGDSRLVRKSTERANGSDPLPAGRAACLFLAQKICVRSRTRSD